MSISKERASVYELPMPSRVAPAQYGQAVLEYVQSGAYPQEEEVVSSELPDTALPEVSKLIEQAREAVQHDIENVSKSTAPDIDGWISQAKQLRKDIHTSQSEAKGIVERSRYVDRLTANLTDAAGKVDLLSGELAFNETLLGVLERLQTLRQCLDSIQKAIIDDRPLKAVELIHDAEHSLQPFSINGAARVADVIRLKVNDLRDQVTQRLTNGWNRCIQCDDAAAKIYIKDDSPGPGLPSLDSIAQAYLELGVFDKIISSFCYDFDRLIVLPRLQVRPDATIAYITVEGNVISANEPTDDLSARSLFTDLTAVLNYLRDRLPNAILEPLAKRMLPHLISRLISTWLTSSVPGTLDEMEDFKDTVQLVKDFAGILQRFAWPGPRELVAWIDSIPKLWLKKRQEVSLGQIRSMLSTGFGVIQTVERIETEVVGQDDDMLQGNGAAEEWNAGWSDEDDIATNSAAGKAGHTDEPLPNDGEDDVSAWGLDDDKDDEGDDAAPSLTKDKISTSVEGDEDPWGWEDDNHGPDNTSPAKSSQAASQVPRNHTAPAQSRHIERAITLKETYNITKLPHEVLEVILAVIHDACTLSSPSWSTSSIASAAQSLQPLPGLLLAMYRAGAASTYTFQPNGSMFLYNDSSWLAEHLAASCIEKWRSNAASKQMATGAAFEMGFESDISALQGHGKRAYAREMELQRTIITDLLDGAQGFSHCTEHPFNQDCDIAIASTVDRFRLLHREWKAILSHSALLQSLGSLLSTVTSKMIVDIEDMSDISEPESQQLTAYCSRVAALEDLFLAQTDDDQAIPATAFYCSNWLKFQYLAQILESSLVDIKYMWTESELGLDFETEELVDLLVALFADSPHRRTAIGEIRAGRPSTV